MDKEHWYITIFIIVISIMGITSFVYHLDTMNYPSCFPNCENNTILTFGGEE